MVLALYASRTPGSCLYYPQTMYYFGGFRHHRHPSPLTAQLVREDRGTLTAVSTGVVAWQEMIEPGSLTASGSHPSVWRSQECWIVVTRNSSCSLHASMGRGGFGWPGLLISALRIIGENLYLAQQTYLINGKDPGPIKPLTGGNPFIHLSLSSLSRSLSATHNQPADESPCSRNWELCCQEGKKCPGHFLSFQVTVGTSFLCSI